MPFHSLILPLLLLLDLISCSPHLLRGEGGIATMSLILTDVWKSTYDPAVAGRKVGLSFQR